MSSMNVDSIAHELNVIGMVVHGRLFLERSTIVEGIRYADSQIDVCFKE